MEPTRKAHPQGTSGLKKFRHRRRISGGGGADFRSLPRAAPVAIRPGATGCHIQQRGALDGAPVWGCQF